MNNFTSSKRATMPTLEFEPIVPDLKDDLLKKNEKYSFKKFF